MSRQRVKLLIICVVIGAILNIAVAWGCAIWSRPQPHRSDRLPDAQADAIWSRIAPPDWSGSKAEAYRQRSIGVTIDVAYRLRDWKDEEDYNTGIGQYAIEYRTGYPLPTSGCTGVAAGWSPDSPKFTHAFKLPRGVPFLGIRAGQVLPYNPIWYGLIINSIFFAAFAWLLIRGPAELRRRIRQLRNCCQACGYAIGTSPVCSECGTPVTHGLRPVAASATKPLGGAGG